MPARLRPTAPIAPAAILVGDPGRSLLLAQELLEQPKMSNHARGLWGYGGRTPEGAELTIQATGMGGPSAALVLADLAELGVERVIRVGTCVGSAGRADPGELLLPSRAIAAEGSASSFGLQPGESIEPDTELLDFLRKASGATEAPVTSLDTMPNSTEIPTGIAAADMQTVAVFAVARRLNIAAASVLIVSEVDGNHLDEETLALAARRAGHAAEKGLSNPQLQT
jgi:purine-nucleoside phosphorylase